jgi:hypothetical protein
MSVSQAIHALAMLHDLGRVVHIAGGEAMMYWPRLKEVVAEAAAAGLHPHFIETNASFAANDGIVRERFEWLREHGVAGIYYSADAFHQEWVSADNAIRVGRIAGEIFGVQNVYGFTGTPESIRECESIAHDPNRLCDYARQYSPMLVGSAYLNFRHLFEDRPLSDLQGAPFLAGADSTGPGCAVQFDLNSIWEAHIDPYGNIQTNCGIILGHIDQTTPRQALDRTVPHPDPFVRMLSSAGPLALAEFARDHHGYRIPAFAKTKCSLCYEVRTFLRPFYPQTFGPAELYPS